MGKLFGTDGIRGVAGKTLTAELAYKVGQSVRSEEHTSELQSLQ